MIAAAALNLARRLDAAGSYVCTSRDGLFVATGVGRDNNENTRTSRVHCVLAETFKATCRRVVTVKE